MVTKKLRKLFAVVMAMAVIVAGAPGVPSTAVADTVDGSATTATDSADSSQDASADADNKDSEEGQKVADDGEVVQDGAVGKVDKSKWITKKDYEFVCESDTYKMYLYQKRLSIMLENKKTGEILESTLSDEKDDGNSNNSWNGYMKSGVVLNAIVGTKNTYQADLINNSNTVDVTKNDKGFSAKIFFNDYQFGLTVNVTLDNDNLVVNVPDDSIIEKKEGTYISTVSLFPLMGYSFLDEQEGYMLVPDGNGALIYLDNKEGRYSTGFSQMIYGSDAGFRENDTKTYLWDKLDMLEDSNEVLAPIFGMAHTKQQLAYLGIVESGEKRASIEVQPNGVTVNYNRCFAKFLLRDTYIQPLNNSNSGTVTQAEADRAHDDLQVRYILLSGDDANYSAMAKSYREYLLNNNQLTKKDTSYNTRVDFLGTDREEFLLGTKAVTMTTTDDIKNIFSELKQNGVSSVLSVYKGWQDGGLYDVPIKKYDPDRHIGSKSDLSDLIKDSAADNYNMYLYGDALRLNPKTNMFNFSTIKMINKRAFEEEIWAEVYRTFNFLTPQKSASYLQSFASSAAKKSINNIALSGISNTLFSYSYKGGYYSRSSTAKAYADAMNSIDDSTNLIMEEPVAYLWKNTDAFLDMPLGTSDYIYIDQEIPFLSMVLKGIVPMYSDYVNFEANKEEYFLQMVEAGVYPSFYITEKDSSALIYTNSADKYSTKYTTYKDSIINYDSQLRQLSTTLGDATIEKHERFDNDVAKVTYSNNAVVYVNYSSQDQTVDGVTVKALSYECKAGEVNE